jgi:putative membrane protein
MAVSSETFKCLLWWIIAGTRGSVRAKPTSTNSLEILKQRYAKGEITEEEFRKMKKEIE